jgi:hypothetical protein
MPDGHQRASHRSGRFGLQSQQKLDKPTGEHLTWYGKDVRLLGAGQVGNVCVERDTLLSGCGLCDGHGHTENGVGTELLLVLGAIKLVQESIDGGLVLDIDLLLDEGWGNGVVDVANSLGHTLTTPLGLVSIAELAGLVGASGCAGRDDGTVQAGLSDDVDLDGRVATRVVDGTGVDLGDSHGVDELRLHEVSFQWSGRFNCGIRGS